MKVGFLIIPIVVGIVFIQSCDKQLSTTPPEDPPPNGLIKINTEPQGFQIWMNGRNTGRIAPDSIPWIESGEYIITMKRKLWKDTSFSITAVEGESVSKDINFYNNPSMFGTIKFTSDPAGSKIYINDSLLSFKTPNTLTHVLPGKYRIRYAHDDHRDGNFIIEVQSSAQANAYIRLRDTTTWVDYQTHNSEIPFNELSGITVDSNNVKWISTLEYGMVKYDEKEYVVYNKNNSPLPSNHINTIKVDKFNNKWIATDNGLAVYNDLDWQIYNTSNSGLSNNTVTAIEFNTDNDDVQLGLADILVTKRGDTFNKIRFTFTPVIVSAIHSVSHSNIWVGTTAYGLYQYLPNLRQFNLLNNWVANPNQVHSVKDLPTFDVVAVESDSKGNIWVASRYDYVDYQTDTGQWIKINKFGGISVYYETLQDFRGDLFLTGSENPTGLFIDKNDKVWMTTRDGLYIYETLVSRTHFMEEFNGLSSNYLTGIVKDKKGIVWITTLGRGLNKYKGEKN